MALVYSIRDWNRHFECAQSRKVEGPLTWVATPCKHDGKSFRRLMALPNGAEIFCAWMLLVQIAAKCPTRGVLADDDGPLTPCDMFIKTGCPTATFETALTVLSDKHIGWLLVAAWEESGSLSPPQDKQTGQNQPTNQPPYPPTPSQPPPNGDPKAGGLAGGKVFEMSWDGVGKRLASIGLVQWSQAVDDAKAAGSDPQRCHDLIDFAIAHDKGPGAIARRFRVASPQLGINSGWPDTQHPQTSAEKRAQRAADQRSQSAIDAAESEAWRLIKAGKKCGKSEEQIKAEVLAAGLPWVNPGQPLSEEEKSQLRKACAK